MKILRCTKDITLSSFLLEENPDYNIKKVKVLLKYKKVKKNKKIVTKWGEPLVKGDIIEVDDQTKKVPDDLDVLYEDKSIIVVNKKAGLLTISTEKEKEKTLYQKVSAYVKSVNKNQRIFVVHRLDKDTSGILVFAKREDAKHILQDNWDSLVIKRGYKAVIEGIPAKKDQTLVHDLNEAKNGFVRVEKTDSSKRAITHYKVLKHNKEYSLIDLEIKTGRKNQIRVQMSYIGYPVVGDAKYGSKSNPIKRMALHADELIFLHPVTKKEMHFELKLPVSFQKLVK